MDKLSDAYSFFSLTISQKNQVMGQATPAPPCITVNGEELEVLHLFQYLGITTTDTLSLDVELSKCKGKGSTTLYKLTKRVWENKHLTILNKINVCKACIISTLLYSSESWSTYSTQELPWNYMAGQGAKHDVLSRAGIPSIFTLLCQCCLYWLGHVHRMEEGHIPKDLLYGELATGARYRDHPQPCFKGVCKHNMKTSNIKTETWEAFADNKTL